MIMNDVFRRLSNSFFHLYFKLFMIKKENMLNEIKIEFFFFSHQMLLYIN